eukprot:SAG31_NODE_10975_length_1077_cov_0.542945_2_plen_157_part_00
MNTSAEVLRLLENATVKQSDMTCPICAEQCRQLCAMPCCDGSMCVGCVDKMVRTKGEAASSIVVKYLDTAHQCPQCGFGPVEHFACNDLTAHDTGFNKCPNCCFRASSIRAWPQWSGRLPPTLAAADGCFTCPFCRKDVKKSDDGRQCVHICTSTS